MADAKTNIGNLFYFFKLCGKLKHLKRTGWVHHKVSQPETVSGHMYRMAMMAFLFNKNNNGVNQEKCIKMALVHDLAESIVGDLTPSCNVSKEEKYKREKEAMEEITQQLDNEVGQELLSLWTEYEMVTSQEAVIVHDLDKFDMIFQAFEYETDQERPGELQQFFDSTKDIFKSSTVKSWAEELHRLRHCTQNTTTDTNTTVCSTVSNTEEKENVTT